METTKNTNAVSLPTRTVAFGRYTLSFKVTEVTKLYGLNGFKFNFEGTIKVNPGKKNEKVLFEGAWVGGYFTGGIRQNYWSDIYDTFWATCSEMEREVLDQILSGASWGGTYTGNFR